MKPTKPVKRLVLHTETLSKEALGQAVGGATVVTACTCDSVPAPCGKMGRIPTGNKAGCY
jgi:hypothetical protein